MYFTADNQTLEDLNVFSKRGKASLFSIFNGTQTQGGAKKLEEIFRSPSADPVFISKRIQVIRLYKEQAWTCFATGEQFEEAELYLSMKDDRTKLRVEESGRAGIRGALMGKDMNFQIIKKGITSLLQLLQGLDRFLANCLATTPQGHIYREELNGISNVLRLPEWQLIVKSAAGKPSFEELAACDNRFRFQHRETIYQLLSFISSVDVYASVAFVCQKRGFAFPELVQGEDAVLDLQEVYHPELADPVANSISFTSKRNLLFLTGANMAGKSTFMKSLGIAVYLAHLGFPVPAQSMRFSVCEGIFTTINLADNLKTGFSHFYAEVMRVKKVAAALQKGSKIFVLIDELFKGTNVKDAHDATIAVTGAFAKKQNSLFVISTHIMEAGEVLQKNFSQICFQYLPTRMQGNKPVYTRKLENGISADRHGMIIIQQEGILDMLNRYNSSTNGIYCRQTNTGRS